MLKVSRLCRLCDSNNDVTAVIGGAKEWYDARHPDKHNADWGDIAADFAGAAGAEGMMWIVHKTW